MGGQGSKCCAAEEVSGEQKDIASLPVASLQHEEVVKSPASIQEKSPAPEPAANPAAKAAEPAAAAPGTTEFVIKLDKSSPGGPRLGVDVDLTDGCTLVIDKVNDGLVSEWNKAHPDLEVRQNDRIIAVNGTSGVASEITDVCKNQMVLEMVIRRDSA